jgi:hypothetical protein
MSSLEEYSLRMKNSFKAENIDMTVVIDNLTIDDSLSNTDFSFLSPSFIKVQGKTQTTTTLNQDDDVYKELESTMLSSKQKSGLSDLVANNGVSITKINDPIPVPIIYQVFETNEKAISSMTTPSIKRNVDAEIIPENAPTLAPSPLVEQAMGTLNLQIAKSVATSFMPKTNTIMNYDISKSVSPILNTSESDTQSIENYVGLPNQVKSLFKASIASDQVRKDIFSGATSDFVTSIDTSSLFEINWSLIQKIEVMVGFDLNEEGYKMVKAERWETLTRSLYDSIRGKVVLCRMTPFSSDQYNIKYNKDIELPIYDGYFLLQVPPVSSDDLPISYKERLQSKISTNYIASTVVNGGFTTTNAGASNSASSSTSRTSGQGGTETRYNTGNSGY